MIFGSRSALPMVEDHFPSQSAGSSMDTRSVLTCAPQTVTSLRVTSWATSGQTHWSTTTPP